MASIKDSNIKDEEIGQAFKAYKAYNYSAKSNRIVDFDLGRWLEVVKALNGQNRRPFLAGKNGNLEGYMKKRAWTSAQRAKFKETMKKKHDRLPSS